MRITSTFIVSALLLGAAPLVLTGCYTVEGVGRDVAATGAGVAEGAAGARDYSERQPPPGDRDRRR